MIALENIIESVARYYHVKSKLMCKTVLIANSQLCKVDYEIYARDGTEARDSFYPESLTINEDQYMEPMQVEDNHQDENNNTQETEEEGDHGEENREDVQQQEESTEEGRMDVDPEPVASAMNETTSTDSTVDQEDDASAINETNSTDINSETADGQQVMSRSSSSTSTPVALPLVLSQAMMNQKTRRTYDLLAKYKDEEELLNAIELMKEPFTNTEITIPQLLTGDLTEHNVQQQLDELNNAIGKSDEKVFFASVEKALLYLTYYLQTRYLMDNDYAIYRKMKLGITSKCNDISYCRHLIKSNTW